MTSIGRAYQREMGRMEGRRGPGFVLFWLLGLLDAYLFRPKMEKWLMEEARRKHLVVQSGRKTVTK
jgi:hypothetical protein